MERGFGPDGTQPPARGEGGEQFVSRVGGVGHYLPASGSWRRAGRGGMADTLSAELMTRCSLPLSLAVAYQKVMEEVRMDSIMEV